MSKIKLLILIILVFSYGSVAQIEELVKYKYYLEKRVSVGSSSEEVKKILGKPKAVESGFPNSSETILMDMPEQVGQLNNSTWFYFFSVRKIKIEVEGTVKYYLNGRSVDEETYLYYQDKDSIFILNNRVLSQPEYEGYKIYKTQGLQSELKIQEKSKVKKEKTKWELKYFTPVLCIIFDRGTQVVASCRAYFILN